MFQGSGHHTLPSSLHPTLGAFERYRLPLSLWKGGFEHQCAIIRSHHLKLTGTEFVACEGHTVACALTTNLTWPLYPRIANLDALCRNRQLHA